MNDARSDPIPGPDEARDYVFGPFRFDAVDQLLFRDGRDVPLQPRAQRVLRCLVVRAGELVTKQALLDEAWSGVAVGESSLNEVISLLRKALGDDPQRPAYIQTVHRRGFRFIAQTTRDGHPRARVAVAPRRGESSEAATDSGTDAATSPGERPVTGSPWLLARPRAVWRAVAGAGLLLAVAAGAWLALRVGTRTDRDGTASSLVARRVWTGPDVDEEAAPLPDGRLAAGADWESGDVRIVDLSSGETRRLTGGRSWNQSVDFAFEPVASPDGSLVAYTWLTPSTIELRVARVDGSGFRVLRSADVGIGPAAWSPDGERILVTLWEVSRAVRIAWVSVEDGTVEVVRTFEKAPGEVSLSPDGPFITYDAVQGDDAEAHDLFLLEADRGSREARPRPIVQHPANDLDPLWLPDGRGLLFLSDRTDAMALWYLPVEGGVPGEPRMVKPGAQGVKLLGFSGDGSLYYSVLVGATQGASDVFTARFDRSRRRLEAPTRVSERHRGHAFWADWSRDGSRLAYESRTGALGVKPKASLVIRSADSGAERELVPDLDRFLQHRWTADGTALLVTGFRGDDGGIFEVDAETGQARLVLRNRDGTVAYRPHEAPSGRFVVFQRVGKPDGLFRLDLESGEQRALFRVPEPGWVGSWALSPDGREMVAVSVELGPRTEVLYHFPVSGGERRERLRLVGQQITAMTWLGEGGDLVYATRPATAPGRVWQLWLLAGDGDQPVWIGSAPPRLWHLSAHPDGERIAYAGGVRRKEIWVLEGLAEALGG